mgnify:FL=1
MLANGNKIFCIGFQKTGTSSVETALTALGLKVAPAYVGANRLLKRRPPKPRAALQALVLEKMKTHDAIQDAPANFFFEEFDQAYPGSKFIFTTRPVDSWLTSYRNFFRDTNSPLHAWMYGVETCSGNEDRFRDVYISQTNKILEHFAGRPQDLLRLDLQNGDGWYELVSFLGPDFLPDFPKVNTTKAKAD